MKNITIKVTVPNKQNTWKISIGNGRPRKKKNAVEIYRHAERFLSRKLLTSSPSKGKDKIKVLVDYHLIHQDKSLDWKNEGLYTEKNEALYVLACFLEDYLPVNYQRTKYKLYGDKLIEAEEVKDETKKIQS